MAIRLRRRRLPGDGKRDLALVDQASEWTTLFELDCRVCFAPAETGFFC